MIFCLETSSPRASLAVIDPTSGNEKWSSAFETNRAHNAAIFSPVETMLTEFRDELTGITVGLGPGSYGGVRVGIAVANGLSMVLGIPAVGISSLECWDIDSDDYLVVGDARRKTFCLAEVRNRELVGEPLLVSPEEANTRINSSEREGLPLVTADRTVAEKWESVSLGSPSACRVARRSELAQISSTDNSTLPSLEPIYLRAPYITEPKPKG